MKLPVLLAIISRSGVYTHLTITAPNLPSENDSTPNSLPIPNVKKPLIAERMVVLATEVKSRLALTAQLAINQKKQNTEASFAVSVVVKGA